MAVVLVQFLLDDTIKTSDDIEKYLGLSTLGMIPLREEKESEKSSHGSGGREHSGGRGRDKGELEYSRETMRTRRGEGNMREEEEVESHGKDTVYDGGNEGDNYAED